MQLYLIRESGVNSAKIVLVSHHLCPYVQRAAIALAEKAVLFERAYIDLADKPAWFTNLSPLGKVPLLRVGEEVIFESSVIVEYLEETQPGPLHPHDPRRQTLSVLTTGDDTNLNLKFSWNALKFLWNRELVKETI